MEQVKYIFPVIHQIFNRTFGRLEGGIFYRTSGYGAELGDGAPLCQVVAARKGKPLGRPATRSAPTAAPAETAAYALDAKGNWWALKVYADGRAVARTITKAPYAKLGGRRHIGWVPTLKARARDALDAAHLDYLRQRCDLV